MYYSTYPDPTTRPFEFALLLAHKLEVALHQQATLLQPPRYTAIAHILVPEDHNAHDNSRETASDAGDAEDETQPDHAHTDAGFLRWRRENAQYLVDRAHGEKAVLGATAVVKEALRKRVVADPALASILSEGRAYKAPRTAHHYPVPAKPPVAVAAVTRSGGRMAERRHAGGRAPQQRVLPTMGADWATRAVGFEAAPPARNHYNYQQRVVAVA